MEVGEDVEVMGELFQMDHTGVPCMCNYSCPHQENDAGDRNKCVITEKRQIAVFSLYLALRSWDVSAGGSLVLNGNSIKAPSPHSQSRQKPHSKTHLPIYALNCYQSTKKKYLIAA